MDNSPLDAVGEDHDNCGINWLEFWPESEFRLEAHGPGPMDPYASDYGFPAANMAQQVHSGGSSQQLGLAAGPDPYGMAPLVSPGQLDQQYKVTPCPHLHAAYPRTVKTLTLIVPTRLIAE
jgi:hypothetical protein